MKIFVLSPNADVLFNAELKSKLEASGDVVYVKEIEPIGEVADLYKGDEERILAIDPDFCNWKVENTDLDKIPNLTGIQWVPGAGKPPMGSPEWIPLYKKIQAAGKNLVIDAAPEIVSSVYKNLDPKGLFVRTFYITENIKNFYLPDFLGGEDGKLIHKARDWLINRGKSRINREELESFLISRQFEMSNRVKKDLLKEINNTMMEKKYF